MHYIVCFLVREYATRSVFAYSVASFDFSSLLFVFLLEECVAMYTIVSMIIANIAVTSTIFGQSAFTVCTTFSVALVWLSPACANINLM